MLSHYNFTTIFHVKLQSNSKIQNESKRVPTKHIFILLWGEMGDSVHLYNYIISYNFTIILCNISEILRYYYCQLEYMKIYNKNIKKKTLLV